MNAKQLMKMATALGVVVIAWVVLALVRRPPADREVDLVLPKIDTTSLDSMVLIKGHDTTVVARAGAKAWHANGLAADSSAVHSLLTALVDTARTTELVAEERTSHERLGVSSDSGQFVALYDHGHPALRLVVGKRTSDYGGVYLRRENANEVFALHGSLADALTRAGDDWRDKRIASVAPDSVATIDIERGGRTYTLRRAGSRWSLESGKAADSSAVASLLGNYRSVTASGFASRAQSDSVSFAKPTMSARLLNKEARPLVSLVFDSTKAGKWVRAEAGGPVYRMEDWTWGGLAPAESTLVAKPATPAKRSKADTKPRPPTLPRK